MQMCRRTIPKNDGLPCKTRDLKLRIRVFNGSHWGKIDDGVPHGRVFFYFFFYKSKKYFFFKTVYIVYILNKLDPFCHPLKQQCLLLEKRFSKHLDDHKVVQHFLYS